MPDLRTLRIVEIGDKPYVKTAFPLQVAYFSTRGETVTNGGQAGAQRLSLATLPSLLRALRDPGVALIVCHPTFHAPWQWQAISRMIFNRRLLGRSFPLVPAFGPQVLRLGTAAPIAVVDHDDLPVINRQNRFLLERCAIYFKRELPCDRWRVFLKTSHANLPTPRFRLQPRHARLLDKLHPISIGLPLSGYPACEPAASAVKDIDVFFAGRIDGSSTLRPGGLRELRALREQGYAIDVADRPMPREEFLRRCRRAWLCWSPEGLGWDCFRHYEVAACGSVPLINQPTIERHQPLLNGIHAIYYDAESGGLTRAAIAALSDKPALAAMAAAGREHVLRHHTSQALASYIVTTALAAAKRGTGGPQ